jgi:hypothetical protein
MLYLGPKPLITNRVVTYDELTGSSDIVIYRKTANYTLVLGDKDALIEMNLAVANNLTIPPNASVAFPIGTEILVSQYGTGQTSLVAGAGVTIDSPNGLLSLSTRFSAVTLLKIGTNEWYAWGDFAVVGGGTFSIKETEIDFGTGGRRGERFTITDALVTPATKIMITPNGNPATGRGTDDWEWDNIQFAAKANTGNFTLFASSATKVAGKRKIFYTTN